MPKYNAKFYFKIWLSYLLVVQVIGYIYFHATNHKKEIIGTFAFVYMLPTWVSVLIVNIKAEIEFMSYLKEFHNAKWQEITYFFGPGGRNSYRCLKFLFSKDNLGDENIAVLKDNSKLMILLIMSVLYTAFPLLILDIFLWCS